MYQVHDEDNDCSACGVKINFPILRLWVQNCCQTTREMKAVGALENLSCH